MTDHHPFFVYGTLRPDLYDGMYHWITDMGGEPQGTAWLHGYELWERAVPYVVPSDDTDSVVRGCLIAFRPEHYERALYILDKYESYNPALPLASLYLRKLVDVQLGDETVKAWCYVANRAPDPSRGYIKIKSGDYAQWRGW